MQQIAIQIEILNLQLDLISPLQLEKLIMGFHAKNLLYENLGITGENIYDITECEIVENWMHFTDEFRHDYRFKMY